MKRRLTASSLVFVGVLAVLLAGCSSSTKDKEEFTGARLSRLQDKGWDRNKHTWDHSVKSEFDQKAYSASTKVKDKKFHAENFSGKHDFKGSSDYKTKNFTQSDKVSRESKEKYDGSDKASKMASKDYATKDSSYGGQKARQGDKDFAGADQAYKTRMLSDAEKSQKKNTKPKILPKEDESGKSVYSEADVKRMVNRN